LIEKANAKLQKVKKTVQTTFEQALKKRIIPVVAIHESANAHPLADALIKGGLPCAEITFRTKAAESVIKTLTQREEILVGAGTVLTIEQAKTAIDAGAGFVVSPGFSEKVVEYCLNQSVPVTPGVCTPTDIQRALDLGLNLVKFFPAEAAGGLKTLKAVCAPYTMMTFIPTGGINAKNLCDYLAHPQVPAVGGSWMVKSSLITDRRFDEIAQLTKEAMALAATLSSD
jgi:2-dehydro-3-deoxyphosphogluconate aldolase/(4S)-4-hydroxy-2-oxoglutarate aldolase